MNSYIALLNKENDTKLVCDKINWWCFFFGPFWALYHGIWSLSIILLLVSSANIILLNIYHAPLLTVEIFRILVSSIAALYANHLLVTKYKKNQYQVVDIIHAPTESFALQRFLDKNLKTHK